MSGLGCKKVHECGEVIWKIYLWRPTPDRRGEYHLRFLNEDKNILVGSKCPRCGKLIVPSDLRDTKGS